MLLSCSWMFFLIDGTYELFRHYYAGRRRVTPTAARSARCAACSVVLG